MPPTAPSTVRAYMQHALDLAVENVETGRGGPFAALIVRDGTVVATGTNRVTTSNDPTAHAEVTAIRAACAALETFDLSGCELYTTCEPCPMCLGAIYWAHLDRVYYAGSQHDAAEAGFDDAWIYDELPKAPGERSLPMVRVLPEAGQRPFTAWQRYDDRVDY